MKQLSRLIVVLLFAACAYSQTEDQAVSWRKSILAEQQIASKADKDRITKLNFSPLWAQLQNSSVFGFIGDDYQRLRVKIISVTRQPGHPDTYNVTGKSMVKNVVRAFTGTMKITEMSIDKNPGKENDEYKTAGVKQAGIVIGEYHFTENKNETSTGSFDGVFATYWYIDRNGRLAYDEMLDGADGWQNNQFVGTWTSYKTKASKVANWGDSRIPMSGDLDIGAGEFYPDEKYLPNGWKSYRDAYTGQDKRAQAEERRQWWK